MDYATRFIGTTVAVAIDRPLGTKHPKHAFTYTVNYGYIEGTTAPDGEEVDAYVLGIATPLKKFSGKCIAVIHRTNDNDDKCIVVPTGTNYSDEDIKKATQFQEQYFSSVIIR